MKMNVHEMFPFHLDSENYHHIHKQLQFIISPCAVIFTSKLARLLVGLIMKHSFMVFVISEQVMGFLVNMSLLVVLIMLISPSAGDILLKFSVPRMSHIPE